MELEMHKRRDAFGPILAWCFCILLCSLIVVLCSASCCSMEPDFWHVCLICRHHGWCEVPFLWCAWDSTLNVQGFPWWIVLSFCVCSATCWSTHTKKLITFFSYLLCTWWLHHACIPLCRACLARWSLPTSFLPFSIKIRLVTNHHVASWHGLRMHPCSWRVKGSWLRPW